METETTFSHVAPPIFDGDNYQAWAVRMTVHLEALDLWEAIEEDYDVPPLPANPTMAQLKTHKERKTRKSKAKAYLFSTVSSTIFTRIMNLESAKDIWDYLKKEYQGNERTKNMKVLNLIREFEMLKMKETENIKDYSDKLLGIVNKVRLLGKDFSDERIVQKILVTLPEKYESKISSLEESKDLSSISLAELVNALQAQEQRRMIRKEESMEGALQAKAENSGGGKDKKNNNKKKNNKTDNNNKNKDGTYPPCPHCKKTNHPQRKCWWRPDVKCRKCGQIGHMERICKSQQHEEAKASTEQHQEEQLFVATCFTTSNSSSDSWLIDSGCTNHMTNDQELFKELDKTIISKVKIGNGEFISVKGKGTVAIESLTGLKYITDVLYVPDIDQNLLSVGQLIEKGFKVIFEDKWCMIKDAKGRDVFKVKMRAKSFALNLMEDEQIAFSSTVSNAELWHRRLGHFHHVGLLYMQKQNLVKGVPLLEDKLADCVACQYGKQTRRPFPQTAWRAMHKLQLVHTDVGGPQKTPSLNGSKYYIAFIDDYTRFCWIYFLKSKSEVANVFWKYKAWVENQSSCRMQKIRSDNGKEYTNEIFDKFCEEAGIEHQLTTPYTPQQNGVSERKNRSIMEMTRCMLHEKELPKKLWAEAANTAVFLLNRLPTRVLQKKTPFEAWFGYKPDLKNLRTFGCLCFSYVPQVKRDKLDKKAEPGVFIGYSNSSKAYRIFQPQNGKILVSRDVKFMEDRQWNWEESIKMQLPKVPQYFDEDIDDVPVRGIRSLSDVYERNNVAVFEPAEFEEAEKDDKWIEAMKEELRMIEKNDTWELVDRPQHRKVIGVKWVYRTKLNADGSVNKYKARLVVKGYSQVFGVDFSETFAPVARLDTIRMLLALTAQKGWKTYQLDVKSAFLNGYLQEEIYVEQPEGFQVKGQEEKVYLLKKALYGLKQAPRAWYSRIDEHLQSLGFVKSPSEATLYVKGTDANLIVVSVYVDDLLVTGSNEKLVKEFKAEMLKVFEMTDLGLMSYFLGMEVKQDHDGVFISQKKYAKEILNKFHMDDCKRTSTPMNQKEKFSKDDGTEKVDESQYRSLIGCLMYLTATRPDIMFSVSLLSRFMHCASEVHFQAAKRIVRYIKGTTNYGIKYSYYQNFKLHGYSDSDWAGSIDDMRSTTGFCFNFGSGIFSWSSKKQDVIAQSTAEAEYVAANATVNQAIWIRKILADLHMKQNEPTQIHVDNQAAIAISNDSVFHGKTKHFKIKLYHLREEQKDGEVKLLYCKTEDQIADVLTKALPKARFETLRGKIGLCSY
ncbi:Retrovirus-related Pol polyprotein from transposon TNT 1-94 [Vitis vinifera]|uniref:Retrovirus-related Pol polyprotein from transposon TNT 1-94 n=1 Tax=Vitis vinifera TaxID=29760 RepID=A0A438J1J0_VITVI|nr:Retrovirus-related Pol polyprotein from transposon TNT 1-94 [Vitis vinifera]